MTLVSLRKSIEKSWYAAGGAFLLLIPFSWVFSLVVSMRKLAYELGLFRRPELPVPVVVVGNITVGGSGKTPVVTWLVKQLQDAGYRPAIVSRGYGGQVRGTPELVTEPDAARFGDEPVLLSNQNSCPIVVCSDRAAAVKRAAQEGADVVVSDDGLQHYRMRRVMEFVVVDGQRGFGNGHLMPAGPLREPVQRAREADMTVINGSGEFGSNGCVFRLVHQGAVSVADDGHRPLDEFSGSRVWAIAGIGNPQRFFNDLREEGILVDETEVPDHGSLDIGDLLKRKLQPVLMTEKDAVKYRHLALDGLWYVPVRAEFAISDSAEIMAALEDRLRKVAA